MSIPVTAHAVAIALAVAGHQAAMAQPYPAKPIRMIVPFAPSGGTDVIARHLAARMGESLKRQIVVDNRARANGIVGSEMVAHAPADGYTLLFVSSPHSVNPSLYAKLPYDTVYRAGTHNRNFNHQVVKFFRAQSRQHRHLRARFDLEHADGVSLLNHAIHGRVITRIEYLLHAERCATQRAHKRQRAAYGGEHAQRQYPRGQVFSYCTQARAGNC